MISKSAKSVLFEINPKQDTKKNYNLSGILVIVDNIELREYLAGHNHIVKLIQFQVSQLTSL
jgi:hypothetical protein